MPDLELVREGPLPIFITNGQFFTVGEDSIIRVFYCDVPIDVVFLLTRTPEKSFGRDIDQQGSPRLQGTKCSFQGLFQRLLIEQIKEDREDTERHVEGVLGTKILHTHPMYGDRPLRILRPELIKHPHRGIDRIHLKTVPGKRDGKTARTSPEINDSYRR